jgi:ParB-like chromosome segregation protein Spo0J
MKNLRPEIVWRDIDSIVPYEHNTKFHPESQVGKIADSIDQLGFDQPIVVDSDGVIIKGHGRLAAAKTIKMTQVPVIVRTDLTPAQVKLARVLDNRTNESEWDIDALSIELSWLNDNASDLDLTSSTISSFDDLLTTPDLADLEDADDAGEPDTKPVRQEDEATEGWEKLHMKLPPETMQVFQDLMHRCKGQPHEQFEKLLSAVDVMALEELARTEARAKS